MNKQVIFAIFLAFFLVYSVFVYTTGTSYDQGREFFTDKAKEGKQLFQEYNCIACHQVYGLGGYMGPDLTNALSQTENAESKARVYLQSGAGAMPDLHLTQPEIEALIAYLNYLDNSGIYPVKKYSSSWIGTVENTIRP